MSDTRLAAWLLVAMALLAVGLFIWIAILLDGPIRTLSS